MLFCRARAAGAGLLFSKTRLGCRSVLRGEHCETIDEAKRHATLLAVKKNIGFAYLTEALAIPGTRLELNSFDRRIKAEVAQRCLHDPGSERARA